MGRGGRKKKRVEAAEGQETIFKNFDEGLFEFDEGLFEKVVASTRPTRQQNNRLGDTGKLRRPRYNFQLMRIG